MSDASVKVVSYNPDWPAMFLAEQQHLTEVLSSWLCGSIEHVGSTAVPGLAAKPVIDIMVPVESLSASKEAIKALQNVGYCYYPYKADVMHWFCKPSPEVRTHHLHLIPVGSELWKQRVAFRDHLRNSPQDLKRYAELKLGLAEQYHDDRELYTQAKWPFIKSVLDKL